MERVDERKAYLTTALDHTRAAQQALRNYEAALGNDGLIHSILEYLEGGLQSLRGSLALLQGSGVDPASRPRTNPNPDPFNVRIIPGDRVFLDPAPEPPWEPPDHG